MKCIINGKKVKNNLTQFSKPVAFMVKANAYGHGLGVCEYVDDVVAAYGVATEEEGRSLRAYTRKPIIVTAPCYKNAELIVKHSLTPLVGDAKELRALSRATRNTVVVHLKVDSGMSRFGAVAVSQTVDNCLYAKSLGNISVKGIATHFASVNNLALAVARFDKHILAAESYCGRLLRHASASSTAMLTDYDMLRIGYFAYRGAMKVVSAVAFVKCVKKGSSVGYGDAYVAERDMRVAVVYGGYADGIRRSSVGYKVSIRGKRSPIIAVCMDVFMVELLSDGVVGDEVIIISGDKDIEKMAERCGVIPYEILVGFTGRCGIEYEK